MTINIFVLEGDLNRKMVVVRFFFCWVYLDNSLPFKVHTDASLNGLGAVIYQTQEGFDRVITYASRSLKPSENNYPSHKLE